MIKTLTLYHDSFMEVTHIYLLYTDIYMERKKYVYLIHTNYIEIIGRKGKKKETIDFNKKNADKLIYLLHKHFKLTERNVYNILMLLK